MPASVARAPLLWASLSVALFLGWQQLTVFRNFGGNWTALFCTGSRQPVPPSLVAGTYRVVSPTGFDGQMYRYVAHDPLLTGEAHRYLDNFALRSRRILIPALAWLLAAGRPLAIDGAYIVVTALACFAGAYYAAALLASNHLHPAWSLLYLVFPSTLIAMDRLIIDLAAVSLTLAAVWFHRTGRFAPLFLTLALSCICRETGFLLVAGFAVAALRGRNWRQALLLCAAALPALAWYTYVQTRVPELALLDSGPLWLRQTGSGPRLFRTQAYPFRPEITVTAQILDAIATAGQLLAFAAAIYLLRKRPTYPLALAAACYVPLALLTVNSDVWDHAYNFGRVFSPLLLAVSLQALTAPGRLLWLVPAAMISARILLELAPQLLGLLGIPFRP